MKKFFLVFCLLFFSVMNLFSEETENIAGYPSTYQYKETQELVSLVKDAAMLIENQGEAAFPEFKKMESKW